MSKKRIQLTINEDLLSKAEAMAKTRYCDSVSEFVEFLLREEERKQTARDKDTGPQIPKYSTHRPQSLNLNEAPPKKKKANEGTK